MHIIPTGDESEMYSNSRQRSGIVMHCIDNLFAYWYCMLAPSQIITRPRSNTNCYLECIAMMVAAMIGVFGMAVRLAAVGMSPNCL